MTPHNLQHETCGRAMKVDTFGKRHLHTFFTLTSVVKSILDKAVLQESIKSAFSKPVQIKGSSRKMGSDKFPNVATVMWPSPERDSSVWRTDD
jgi:hypothetical protein